MFLPRLLGAGEVGLLPSLQLLQLQLLLLVRWPVLRPPCLPVSAWLPVVLLLLGSELQLCSTSVVASADALPAAAPAAAGPC